MVDTHTAHSSGEQLKGERSQQLQFPPQGPEHAMCKLCKPEHWFLLFYTFSLHTTSRRTVMQGNADHVTKIYLLVMRPNGKETRLVLTARACYRCLNHSYRSILPSTNMTRDSCLPCPLRPDPRVRTLQAYRTPTWGPRTTCGSWWNRSRS